MRREKRNIDEVVKRRVVKRRQREWYSAQYLFHCSCLIVYIISLVVGTLCGMQHLNKQVLNTLLIIQVTPVLSIVLYTKLTLSIHMLT